MNYSELTQQVEATTENTFTSTVMANMVKMVEQKLYEAISGIIPLRKNATATMTTSDRYLQMPTDFLYTHQLALILTSGKYVTLLSKDVSFIRDAYPNPATSGQPKYYANFDNGFFLIGPTPDQGYTVELHYGHHPTSIVTATNTWLGDNFDSALFNGVMVEAVRYMKGEEDLIDFYGKLYLESITLLKGLSDGKLQRDSYRDGQPIG